MHVKTLLKGITDTQIPDSISQLYIHTHGLSESKITQYIKQQTQVSIQQISP